MAPSLYTSKNYFEQLNNYCALGKRHDHGTTHSWGFPQYQKIPLVNVPIAWGLKVPPIFYLMTKSTYATHKKSWLTFVLTWKNCFFPLPVINCCFQWWTQCRLLRTVFSTSSPTSSAGPPVSSTLWSTASPTRYLFRLTYAVLKYHLGEGMNITFCSTYYYEAQ